MKMEIKIVLYRRMLLRQVLFRVLYWWVVAGYMYVYICTLQLFVFWYQGFCRQLDIKVQRVTVIFHKIILFIFILNFADTPGQMFTQLQPLHENAINFSSVLWLKKYLGQIWAFCISCIRLLFWQQHVKKTMVSIPLSLFLCDLQGRIHLIWILAL